MTRTRNGYKPGWMKHIYQNKNTGNYTIIKTLDGVKENFGTYHSLKEAIETRDYLMDNGWTELPENQERDYQDNVKEYYKYIGMNSTHTSYMVFNNKAVYLGGAGSIEEALYFRELYGDCNREDLPDGIDLTTGNHFLVDGLEYPLPERLFLKESNYGKGVIRCKGKQAYAIYHGGGKGGKRYVCSCRTYEQAYYVRQEMNKCGWDRSKLSEILEGYPVYYTWLMEFYRYINRNPDTKDNNNNNNNKGKGLYVINIPHEYASTDCKVERLGTYNRLEDALHERDFLVANDWDYDLLVETIDDTNNPYYNMELPPFPERQIRNIRIFDYHEKELTIVYELLREDNNLNLPDIVERVDFLNNEITLRNWLSKGYNTTFREFKRISSTGVNPVTVLEKVKKIYTPDLSKIKPSNFKGYIHKDTRNKRSPYRVDYKHGYFGSYSTLKQAREAVKLLKECNWDKSKLKSIQEKVGWTGLKERGNIYPYNHGKSYCIRRKDKSTRKMINYGSYKDYELAVIVRDLLKNNDWDKNEYPELRVLGEDILFIKKLLKDNMFSGVYDTLILDCLINLELNDNDTEYITYVKPRGTYVIRKNINGENSHFGTYYNMNDALLARELLEFHNWDMSKLEEVI